MPFAFESTDLNDMTIAQHAAARKTSGAKKFTEALDEEAGELTALHSGLVRHLSVWRDAHETAIMRIGAVMARMDAMLERIERRNEGA